MVPAGNRRRLHRGRCQAGPASGCVGAAGKDAALSASTGSWAPQQRRVPRAAAHRALAGWPEESGLAANTNVARGAGRGSAGRGVGPERGTIHPLFLRLLGAFRPRGNGGERQPVGLTRPQTLPPGPGGRQAQPSRGAGGAGPRDGQGAPFESWPCPFRQLRGVGGGSQQIDLEAYGHPPGLHPPPPQSAWPRPLLRGWATEEGRSRVDLLWSEEAPVHGLRPTVPSSLPWGPRPQVGGGGWPCPSLLLAAP